MIDEIKNRRSIRQYKSDPVTDENILEIIKAGQFAPESHGNKATEFLVIKDHKTKEKIFEVVGAEFIRQAPVIIIPVIDTTKTQEPIQDLSVISENIFLQATELGLGTVWNNIAPERAEKIRPIINLPANFTFINVIPVGYPAEEIPPHADEDFSQDKIHDEKW